MLRTAESGHVGKGASKELAADGGQMVKEKLGAATARNLALEFVTVA